MTGSFAYCLYGYFYTLVATLELQQIPLYIAGRYRDLNSAWELPLAGQILGIAQFCVLFVPSCLGPVLLLLIFQMSGVNEADWKTINIIRSLVIVMLIISILPLRRLLEFEAAQRRI